MIQYPLAGQQGGAGVLVWKWQSARSWETWCPPDLPIKNNQACGENRDGDGFFESGATL